MITINSIVKGMEGRYDDDAISAAIEEIPYELIHILLNEIERLGELVTATRQEANKAVAGQQKPYPYLAENVWNMTFYDHPAMHRYQELYCDNPF